jgi:hypothetical protein
MSCVSGGIRDKQHHSRDPQFGHRRRLSSRESGKPLPLGPDQVLIWLGKRSK